MTAVKWNRTVRLHPSYLLTDLLCVRQ